MAEKEPLIKVKEITLTDVWSMLQDMYTQMQEDKVAHDGRVMALGNTASLLLREMANGQKQSKEVLKELVSGLSEIRAYLLGENASEYTKYLQTVEDATRRVVTETQRAPKQEQRTEQRTSDIREPSATGAANKIKVGPGLDELFKAVLTPVRVITDPLTDAARFIGQVIPTFSSNKKGRDGTTVHATTDTIVQSERHKQQDSDQEQREEGPSDAITENEETEDLLSLLTQEPVDIEDVKNKGVVGAGAASIVGALYDIFGADGGGRLGASDGDDGEDGDSGTSGFLGSVLGGGVFASLKGAAAMLVPLLPKLAIVVGALVGTKWLFDKAKGWFDDRKEITEGEGTVYQQEVTQRTAEEFEDKTGTSVEDIPRNKWLDWTGFLQSPELKEYNKLRKENETAHEASLQDTEVYGGDVQQYVAHRQEAYQMARDEGTVTFDELLQKGAYGQGGFNTKGGENYTSAKYRPDGVLEYREKRLFERLLTQAGTPLEKGDLDQVEIVNKLNEQSIKEALSQLYVTEKQSGEGFAERHDIDGIEGISDAEVNVAGQSFVDALPLADLLAYISSVKGTDAGTIGADAGSGTVGTIMSGSGEAESAMALGTEMKRVGDGVEHLGASVDKLSEVLKKQGERVEPSSPELTVNTFSHDVEIK